MAESSDYRRPESEFQFNIAKVKRFITDPANAAKFDEVLDPIPTVKHFVRVSGKMRRVELVRLIKDAHLILIFTGAGISTGSGIPDYRGPSGLWKTRTPVYYQEFMSSDDARQRYWQEKFEGWESYRDARPNEAHRACVELERAGKRSSPRGRERRPLRHHQPGGNRA